MMYRIETMNLLNHEASIELFPTIEQARSVYDLKVEKDNETCAYFLIDTNGNIFHTNVIIEEE